MEEMKEGRRVTSTSDHEENYYQDNSIILFVILIVLIISFFHTAMTMHTIKDFVCGLVELISCYVLWGIVIND